jgi:hypothetical protein
MAIRFLDEEEAPTTSKTIKFLDEQPAPSAMQQMFGVGSPLFRTVKGAIIDPALAVNEMLARTGLFGQDIAKGASANVTALNKAVEEARAAQGSTGFDPYQLLGAVAAVPISGAVGAVTAPGRVGGTLAKAATTGERMAAAARTGAGLAALQPVGTTDSFGQEKLAQVATGAVLGPAFEGVVKGAVGATEGLKKIARKLQKEGRTEELRTFLLSLTGGEQEAVINSLKTAPQIVKGSAPTTAEAISNIPAATELANLQRKMASTPGVAGQFEARAAEQEAARQATLAQIAGTPSEQAALKAQRAAITMPMRETALNQSDVAGQIIPSLEKSINSGFNDLASATQTASQIRQVASVKGAEQQAGKPGWLTAGDIAAEAGKTAQSRQELAEQTRSQIRLKEFQAKSLEDNGFFPLKANDIVQQINAAIKGTTSDDVKLILQNTREKIISKADDNGIVSSRDLYENVRKSLNRDIGSYMTQAGKPFQGGLPEQEAKAATSIKGFIDSALNKSSDGLWSKYLNTYADASNKLNRMAIGTALSEKLGGSLGNVERAGAFANAVQDAGSLIKKSTGLPRYESISQVLTKEETGAVNRVLADLQRKSKATNLSLGVSPVPEGAENISNVVPSMLSRTATVAKAALDYLQKGNKEEYNKQVTALLLNPQELSSFLSSLPKAKEDSVAKAMLKLMNPETRSAFIQTFAVQPVAKEMPQ